MDTNYLKSISGNQNDQHFKGLQLLLLQLVVYLDHDFCKFLVGLSGSQSSALFQDELLQKFFAVTEVPVRGLEPSLNARKSSLLEVFYHLIPILLN